MAAAALLRALRAVVNLAPMEVHWCDLLDGHLLIVVHPLGVGYYLSVVAQDQTVLATTRLSAGWNERCPVPTTVRQRYWRLAAVNMLDQWRRGGPCLQSYPTLEEHID